MSYPKYLYLRICQSYETLQNQTIKCHLFGEQRKSTKPSTIFKTTLINNVPYKVHDQRNNLDRSMHRPGCVYRLSLSRTRRKGRTRAKTNVQAVGRGYAIVRPALRKRRPRRHFLRPITVDPRTRYAISDITFATPSRAVTPCLLPLRRTRWPTIPLTFSNVRLTDPTGLSTIQEF